MRVAIYLRVSTIDQATRGNTNRDGFSIPAQREACLRKAESLKATVIKEYVDRGESARSAARPALQRLLNDLITKKNFDYVIVHKLDRLARNLHDDVTICLTIKKSGAQLISVTENIDESPSGGLLHGIIAAIAEFYSRNLAMEALKGATEKAKQGGTPYQAPIGYTNIIERINHRENRTIILDNDRAHYITWGLESFATGDYTQRRLQEELDRRGLRTRPNGKSAGKPLSITSVCKMLRNRYYLGYVKYNGVEYKGNHRPLITPAVFAAVQLVLAHQKSNKGKSYKHHHYLSRLLVCDRCGRRLCYGISKRKFHYYFCLNRRDTGCEQPYIPLDLIEKAIINALSQIKYSDEERKKLATEISEELEREICQAELEIKKQKQRIDRLQTEQENLLKAYYDKIIDSSLMKKEQKRINKEIQQGQGVAKESEKRLKILIQRKDRALDLALGLNVGAVFMKANPIIKRHFCQALFSEIIINDKPNGQYKEYWWIKKHNVRIKINWHKPINIHHLSEAVLALSLERSNKMAGIEVKLDR